MKTVRMKNINTNKIYMRTYKEFILLTEKFKIFPEDKVSRQINRKKKIGNDIDAHKMKVSKNFMTKSNKENHKERAINTIQKNTYAMVHRGDDEGINAQNVDVISRLVKRHNEKSKLKDLDQQTNFNKKNKENKKNLNKLYKNENT